MQARHFRARNLSLAAAAIFFCGMFLSGCYERFTTFRDTTIPIPKHATWAWRPMQVAPVQAQTPGDGRKVLSRDVIGQAPQGNEGGPQRQPAIIEPDAANEVVRQQVRTAVERELTRKGFTQVSDPEAADFLADYKLAVQHRDFTVVKGYGGYGGPVCGPYGCWNSWGYGPTQAHYENVRFREGTFVFDFLKRNTLQLAYRGQGQEPAHKGNFSQDNVQDMMHRLLSRLKGR
jgi:Domain of unknown function (DUF4136)